MSRTRHHDKTSRNDSSRRKKFLFQKQNLQELVVEDEYIELPITRQFSNRLSRRERAWS